MKVNRAGASGGLSVRALAVLAAGALLFVGAASCVEKIRVPPPPGAPAVAKTSQTFNYDHKLRQVDRQRRLVVALMRPGDVVRLADYLPFGRGLSATRTGPGGKTTQWILRDGTEDAPVSMPPPIRQFLMRELLEGREFLLVERERILDGARGEAEHVVEKAKRDIAQSADIAREALRERAGALAVEVAEKVLRTELSAEQKRKATTVYLDEAERL